MTPLPTILTTYFDHACGATGVALNSTLLHAQFGDIEGIGVEEVNAMMASGKPVQVIEVRPRLSVSRAHDIADGVQWRDPERIQQWIGELARGASCLRRRCGAPGKPERENDAPGKTSA